MKNFLKKDKNKIYLGIAFNAVIAFLGYIVLEFVSTMENPPLGNTFNIFIGSTLICVGLLGMFLFFKQLFKFNKKERRKEKRRKKQSVVFLKKQKNQ